MRSNEVIQERQKQKRDAVRDLLHLFQLIYIVGSILCI